MADEDRIPIKCRCGAKLSVPSRALGRKVRCPKCRSITALPAPDAPRATVKPAKPLPATAGQQLVVACRCGARLKAPPAAAGHRAKCPRCGHALTIPEASPPTTLKTAATAPLDNLLDALAKGPLVLPTATQGIPMPPSSASATDSAQRPPAPTDAYPVKPAQQQPVAQGPPIACPSCSKTYSANAKICPECGIYLKTGQALITSDEENLHRAYAYTERILTWLSWLLPSGLYPFASEAFGTRTPWVTRGLALATILASIFYFFAVIYNSDPSPAHLELMLWSGQGRPGWQTADEARAELEQRLRGRGWNDEQLQALRETNLIDTSPRYLGQYRPHQLFTHLFLHADPLHLAGNLLFLMVLGARVNALIGNTLTLVFYPLLGLIAALAQMTSMASGPLTPSLGASGAVMGLAGMYLIFFPIHKVHMAFWWRWGLIGRFHLHLKTFAVRGFWVVLFYIAFDILYVALGLESDVAHWAHLGGLLGGIGFALLLLVTRLVNARGGDLLTTVLGRHAWHLIGKPNPRTVPLW